jgi:hypothetical protein
VRDVELHLDTSQAKKSAKQITDKNEVAVKGTSLEFSKAPRTIILSGPVTADAKTQQLKAGKLTVKLGPEFKVQSLVATGGPTKALPEVGMHTATGISVLRAETLTSLFSPRLDHQAKG